MWPQVHILPVNKDHLDGLLDNLCPTAFLILLNKRLITNFGTEVQSFKNEKKIYCN